MSEARNTEVIAESRRQTDRLSRLGWYHSIELPDGGVIEGHQSIEQLRRRIAQFPIPNDLRGKRVLDIGAWDGWFSFEMERRGADVLAVDSTKNTRLLEARRLLGSRIEYRTADICRLTAKDVGTFDIVLFLGVLYHVKHPLLALENVCGMCRDMACVESFVTDADLSAIPQMEFYETTELRGQLDNWVGPNAACLMAFCRTAGFARVDFESALGERAHVTGYRHWLEAAEPGHSAPHVLCVENSATHGHDFSGTGDDYVTFYFTSPAEGLNCDTVHPRIGSYGSRPIHVARAGSGWQATCKLPPGLDRGWHDATLRTSLSPFSTAARIGVDNPAVPAIAPDPTLAMVRIADGKTFAANRVRMGEDSSLSVWATGLPTLARASEIRLRLNGSDLPALWIAPADADPARQINALLPSGLEPGPALLSLVLDGRESAALPLELHP